jgi:hypothetical protein
MIFLDSLELFELYQSFKKASCLGSKLEFNFSVF